MAILLVMPRNYREVLILRKLLLFFGIIVFSAYDAQGSLTASMGYQRPDQMENTLAAILGVSSQTSRYPPVRTLSTIRRALTSFPPILSFPV